MFFFLNSQEIATRSHRGFQQLNNKVMLKDSNELTTRELNRLHAIAEFLGDDWRSVWDCVADAVNRWHAVPGHAGTWFMARDLINKEVWPDQMHRLRDRHAGKPNETVFSEAAVDIGYILKDVLRTDRLYTYQSADAFRGTKYLRM